MNDHEYKFRIWHKGIENKRQSVPPQMIYDELPGNCFQLARQEQTEHPVMQGISRKDNNGKDIYEGDILKDNYDRRLVVERYHDCFVFRALLPTNFIRTPINDWYLPGETQFPEIIGNIYANPELIPCVTE